LRNTARRSTTLPTTTSAVTNRPVISPPRHPPARPRVGSSPSRQHRPGDRHGAEEGDLAERDHAGDQLACVEHRDDAHETEVERHRPADEPDPDHVAPGDERRHSLCLGPERSGRHCGHARSPCHAFTEETLWPEDKDQDKHR
jgi:hypothetical protein